MIIINYINIFLINYFINTMENKEILNEGNINNDIYKLLFDKITFLENENKSIKQEIKTLQKVNKFQIKSLNEKITQLQSEIRNLKHLNNFNLERRLIENEQIKKINIKEKKTIKEHENWICYINIFPNKNFISVSMDKSICIFNNDGKLINKILNAHDDYITYITINPKNNNFITCSYDNNIKIWSYINNEYKNINTIFNAHEKKIWKVLYYNLDKESIISCSEDCLIKIWEKNNNNYQCITYLNHNGTLKSILLLKEEKNIVSAGNDGTIFWNMEYYTIDKNIKEALCYMTNALKRIGKDNIIVSGGIYHKLKVINIHQKIIIREIDNSFQCYDICEIPSFRLFFVCGGSKNIKIYREDNFESVQIITNAHNNFINGFLFLDNDIFLTYSYQTIKIWKLEIN